MKKNMFTLIGGDQRSIATANQLCRMGFDVQVFGFNTDVCFDSRVIHPATLKESMRDADYIILPLPALSEGELLNTPLYENTVYFHDLLPLVNKSQLVFGGKITPSMSALLQAQNITCYDYSQREEFSVLNAIPTAEGAISIALQELPYTLSGTRCLVTGFGRIGKVLCRALDGLGAKVTASARKYSDLAWIDACGYTSIHTKDLKKYIGQFQVILNTVPDLLFDRETLICACTDCLMIDLASKPGGIDFACAEKIGIKVIWALSLPGKTAPLTAGTIIGNTILNIIQELEVKV